MIPNIEKCYITNPIKKKGIEIHKICKEVHNIEVKIVSIKIKIRNLKMLCIQSWYCDFVLTLWTSKKSHEFKIDVTNLYPNVTNFYTIYQGCIMYTPKYKVRMEHFFQIYVKLKMIWKVLILCNSRSLDSLQGFQKSNTMHIRRKKEKPFEKKEEER